MLEISDSTIRQENEIKMTQIGKEEVKLMPLLYDIILSLEVSREATGNFLHLISNFIKTSRYNDNQYQ